MMMSLMLKHRLTLPNLLLLLPLGLLRFRFENRLGFNNAVGLTLKDDVDNIKVLFNSEANSLIRIVIEIGISGASSSLSALSAIVGRVNFFVTIINFFTIIILGSGLGNRDWWLRHRDSSHSESVHHEVSSSLVEVYWSDYIRDDDNNLIWFFDLLFSLLFIRGLIGSKTNFHAIFSRLCFSLLTIQISVQIDLVRNRIVMKKFLKHLVELILDAPFIHLLGFLVFFVGWTHTETMRA